MFLRNRTGLTQGLTDPAGPSVVLSTVYWNLSEKRLWYAKLSNNSVAKGLMETWIQIPHSHQYVGERSNSECVQLQLVKHGEVLRHGSKLHFSQWCPRSCQNWWKYKCRKKTHQVWIHHASASGKCPIGRGFIFPHYNDPKCSVNG